MPAAVTIDKLGKCFQVPIGLGQAYLTLRETLQNLAGRLAFWKKREPTTREFWALKDITFEVQPGEVVGLIGRNGAGKSTLLKILSRITAPSVGEVRLRGRVGSLLEVGTGFHPELSGRENIFLNGSILGMSQSEIRRKFDEIVAFAEVERFLDTPVKRYSSGMYGRLAFAVAAHLEPEILVVDEVLAVGDAEFQKKCLKKMGDVAHEGRTILFVSHDMGAIQAICNRTVLLDQGRMQTFGPTREVVGEYLRVAEEIGALPLSERTDRSGLGRFRFESIEFLDAQGQPAYFAVTGEDLFIRLRLKTPEVMSTPLDVAITVRDHNGHKLTELASYFTVESPASPTQAREVICRVPRVPFLAGEYRLDLFCATSFDTQDRIQDAATLRVEAGNFFRTEFAQKMPAERYGCIVIPQEWGDRSTDKLHEATTKARVGLSNEKDSRPHPQEAIS
jgi:lipopolysaccharide transport system ATP-binding protein